MPIGAITSGDVKIHPLESGTCGGNTKCTPRSLAASRNEWLNRAVFLCRPSMRSRTGLIVPSVKIRVAKAMHDRADAVCIPRCQYGKATILLRDKDYSARPWVPLGIVIHELIHAAGVWDHSSTFGEPRASAVCDDGLTCRFTRAGS